MQKSNTEILYAVANRSPADSSLPPLLPLTSSPSFSPMEAQTCAADPLCLQVSVRDGRLKLYGSDAAGVLRRVALTPRCLERTSAGLQVRSGFGGQATASCTRDVFAAQESHSLLRQLVADHLCNVAVASHRDRLELTGLVADVAAAYAYLTVAAYVLPGLAVHPRPPLALVGGVREGQFQLLGRAADGTLQPTRLQARAVRRGDDNEWRVCHLSRRPVGPDATGHVVQASSEEELAEALRLLPKCSTVEVSTQKNVATVRAAGAAPMADVLEFAALLRLVVMYVGGLAATQREPTRFLPASRPMPCLIR